MYPTWIHHAIEAAKEASAARTQTEAVELVAFLRDTGLQKEVTESIVLNEADESASISIGGFTFISDATTGITGVFRCRCGSTFTRTGLERLEDVGILAQAVTTCATCASRHPGSYSVFTG